MSLAVMTWPDMARTYDAASGPAIMGQVTKMTKATRATEWEAPETGGSSRGPAGVEAVGFALLVVVLVAVVAMFDTGHEDVFARVKFRAALLGVGVLTVFTVVAGNGSLRRFHPADWLVIAYVGWSSLAWVLAPGLGDQWQGERYQFQGMGSVAVYGLLYLAARRFVPTAHRLTSLLWWLLAVVTFVAVYGVMQRTDLDPVWDTLLDGRVFSTIGNPNTLASVLVLVLPVAYYFGRRGARAERTLAALAAVTVLAALVFTASRGGFIAAGIGAILFLGLGPRVSRRGLEGAAAAALVLVAMVIAVSPLRAEVTDTWDRAVSTFDADDESRRFHVDGWRVTVAMIADHPLTGIGHERFPLEFPEYRDRELSEEAVARFAPYRLEGPHNVPLAIAVGAGLPALALYLAVVCVAVTAWLRQATERVLRATVVAVVASHLVADMFVTADLSSAGIFWTILGAMVSTVQVSEDATAAM